ncbi:MAG TPA: ABC-F family ATP-binding cassette domain-containing protein [Gaiellaceae bacterium]|nr:ABC-F family ATP-binding cassette domain-containing protein [Gaiellaceae bacterium]
MRGSLAAHEITKSYGAETILSRVSLTVPPGARIGVLGPNGIGKSTLLRVLAGVEEPDAGSVVRDGEVGFLPQEADAEPGETLVRYLARRTGIAAAETEMDALAASLGAEPELAERYGDALDRFLTLGGGDFEARARAVCAEVGLEALVDRPLAEVSGGQGARARLAAILLARFDVFCLDEPTNDLDFAGLGLLERFVAGLRGTLVVVSHDRAFLERAVDRIVELEAETRRVREFAGGFGEYERMRAAARRAKESAFARYAEERDRFSALAADRRTEARAGGKQANRRGTHALASKVRSAERRLERLEAERPETPWNPWRLQLELAAGSRGGEVVAALDGAVVRRGSFSLGPVDLELRRGDRLALVGPNGSGKTTLLAALLGELPLAAGRRRVGPGARLGRLDQGRALFAGDEPLLEPFRREAGLSPVESRTLLGRFALRGDAVLRPARSLSPGERTRALVALLAARGVNALVLDEPTNHLDLEAIGELEAALAGFEGAVVLVSHDRRLLEAFAPTRTLALDAPYLSAS